MSRTELRVGMVGFGFMGRAHSEAWRRAGRAFDLPLQPVLTAICGLGEEAVNEASRRLGWQSGETDWHRLVGRDDIDVIDICSPVDLHAPIAVAALEAGKHVLCEKPLATNVEEGQRMVAAAVRARAAGVRSMVAFNYRRVPAIALGRQLIDEGRIGSVFTIRVSYLQDWCADPAVPLLWRFRAEQSGTGALSEAGAHIIDLAQYLVGDQIVAVAGVTAIFITERPLLDDPTRTGPVTGSDAGLFVGRFARGALASFDVSRVAPGRKNALGVEVNGSRGSIHWDLERLNELQVYDGPLDDPIAGFKRVIVTDPSHPYIGAWWPPGHIIGWEHAFIHEVGDFVRAIADGKDPVPTFEEGLSVERVVDAVVRSGAEGRWIEINNPA